MRKKRADGRAVEGLPAYRRMMPYLMRTRNESMVLFEQRIDMTRADKRIDEVNAAHPALKVTPFHLLIWAAVRTLDRHPHLNRFVAGGRIYDRDGIWISYSAKKEMVEDSPLVVVKRRFDASDGFIETVRGMREQLDGARTEKRSYTDKELGLILRLPGLGIRGLMAVERAADALGLLPRSYIERDPMFASVFIANLGSLKMDSAFHHLYEYGSVSIFCVVGREERGDAGSELVLRFTYDERIEDGFYANRALGDLRSLIEDSPELL